MAIVIHELPAERALIGSGQTQYTFYGDERVAATGVEAINLIALQNIREGAQIRLIWGGVERVFTARTSPAQPYELPLPTAGSSYYEAVIPWISEAYDVRKDFTVSLAAPFGIMLKARRPGPQYNLETTGELFLGAQNTRPGRGATLRPRYSVQVTLFVQRSGTDGSDLEQHYEVIFDAPVETGADGYARLDVAPLLAGYLSASYPEQTPRLEPTTHRAYYVEYAEAYGDPIQIGRVKRSPLRHIYRGGASVARAAGSGYSLDGFVDQPGRLAYALRPGSRTRYVSPSSIQFLSFLNIWGTVPSVLLQVEAVWDKGAAQLRRDLVKAMPWPIHQILTYGVGPDQLGLASLLPSLTLQQYQIRLCHLDGTLITEPYTFILDYATRPLARQFAYVNSFGVPDVLTTWGKGSTDYELVSQQADRPLTLPYQADEGQMAVYDTALQEQLTVATGFRPLAETRTWREFYLSTEKWWLRLPLARSRPDARVPVAVLTKTIRETQDGQNLHAHQFGVALLRSEHYYTLDDDQPDDVLPPKGAALAGTVVVQPAPTVVPVKDPRLTDAVLELVALAPELKKVVTQGDINQKGFLKQGITDQLYRSAEQTVPVSDIGGLTDVVYTRAETDQQQAQLASQQIRNTPIRVLAVPANFLPQ